MEKIKGKKIEIKQSLDDILSPGALKTIKQLKISKGYLLISLIAFMVLIIAGSVCYFLNLLPKHYYVWIILFDGINCAASIMNWIFLLSKDAVPNDLFGWGKK